MLLFGLLLFADMGCGTYIVGLFIAAVIALKIYLKLRVRYNGSMKCLVKKTVIDTGANTGIGFSTALDFAKRGARVILACRNHARGEEAEYKIRKISGNQNVVFKMLDLSSFKSIRDFAKDINATEARLDILVNNAGGTGFGNHVTDDGIQVEMQINYVGPFLLTHLLLNKLKSSKPSRIVNVSSRAAKRGTMDIKTINKYPEGSTIMAELKIYSATKLGNILFTRELARKLQGTGITVNTLHPGVIATEFSRRFPGIVKNIADIVTKYFCLNPEEGAQTTIYVALSKDLDGISGGLFDNCRQIEMYKSAQDLNLAKQIWQKTEELAKLKNEEKVKT